jgi:hypothetical protein
MVKLKHDEILQQAKGDEGIIIFHQEFRPGWPVSVSAVISSSSLLRGLPGRRVPFGR